MSTQPSSRPPAGEQAANVPAPAESPSSVLPLISATITLLLGAALGLANQAANETSLALRVPALLAALLMVGQGALNFKEHMPPVTLRRRKPPQEKPAEPKVIDESGQVARPQYQVAQAGTTNVRALPNRPISGGAVQANPQTLAVPITVMLLAAWLGLADLMVDSSSSALTILSLIAAFALFVLGWMLLPARR